MTRRTYYQNYYRKNKERIKRTVKLWRQRNPDRVRAIWKRYQKRHYKRLLIVNREKSRRLYRKHRERYAASTRRSRRRLRQEFIAAYGGRCGCCGEREHAFLTVEHKRRDGKEHRARVGTSTQILADLKRRGWPKRDYELLCFNCNRASWELGVCPHRQKRRSRR